MAYINRELALKLLERNSITKNITFSDGVSIYDTIANIPAADVVPKSEYDNLKSQFEALDHECDRLERAESNRHDAIEQAKTEVAREIFEEIEKLFCNVMAVDGLQAVRFNPADYADLKKKYTEGE